jgi:hypothetical protein
MSDDCAYHNPVLYDCSSYRQNAHKRHDELPQISAVRTAGRGGTPFCTNKIASTRLDGACGQPSDPLASVNKKRTCAREQTMHIVCHEGVAEDASQLPRKRRP